MKDAALAERIAQAEPRLAPGVETRPHGAGVRLGVVDSGIGMSADEIATARQPFGQTERGKALGHAGTGLGLPICTSLVALLGGDLAIHSAPGRGTRVDLRLPAETLTTAQGQATEPASARLNAPAPDRASAA